MATPTHRAAPAAGSRNGGDGSSGPHRHRPLGSYAVLTTVFNAAFAGALLAGRDRLPERFSPGDLALMAVGTHKLSRLIAKDRVTSAVRAPFTAPHEEGGPGEVHERPRGDGLRRALGELLTCPYCLDQWVAGGFVAGMVLAPRATRTVASMFTVVAGSDVLQHGYKLLQERA
jgi:Protein of unknown function (DUF1360)